jgi:hypothetical protein
MENPLQFGEIHTFLKSISTAKILKILRFLPEDNVKRKVFNMKVVIKFYPDAY